MSLRKGGPVTRLSFCLLLLASSLRLVGADPLEDALDLDYGRSLFPGPDAPRPSVGALPGFAAPHSFAGAETGRDEPDFRLPAADSAGMSPRLGAYASLRHLDLVRRKGSFPFAHSRNGSSFGFSLAAAPLLELHFAADRENRDLSMGDSGASIDAGGREWGWRAAMSVPATGVLVPSVVVGGHSSDPAANAMAAVAFRGKLPAGLAWSFAWGREHRDYPIRLELPDYAPLSLPFLFRRDFREAGLAYERGPWEASWSGRWTSDRTPRIRPAGYSLADSARGWRQEARAAFSGGKIMAALDFDLGMGRHVFRGYAVRHGVATPFSWQRAGQADYTARADLAFPGRAGGWGGWLAAGEAEYDALPPELLYGHWFWDRNGVIDSYQGSVLGLFSGETWLLEGTAYAGYAGLGVWRRGKLAGFGYRLSAGYQYLLLDAESHLTRRRTMFILGYTERTSDRAYPTIEADLVPVGLELARAWGSFKVTMGGRAALPARIRMEGEDPGGTGGSGRKARYRGGTSAGLRVEYGLR